MIDKTMSIREVLDKVPGSARIMMSFGLHCLGCPHATAETLEEAGAVHMINVDEMVHQINELVAQQEAEKN